VDHSQMSGSVPKRPKQLLGECDHPDPRPLVLLLRDNEQVSGR